MMFGTIVVNGIQMIGKCGYSQRNITIVALSLVLVLVYTGSEIFAIFHSWYRMYSQRTVAVVFLVPLS